jgi:hypothetical protein
MVYNQIVRTRRLLTRFFWQWQNFDSRGIPREPATEATDSSTAVVGCIKIAEGMKESAVTSSNIPKLMPRLFLGKVTMNRLVLDVTDNKKAPAVPGWAIRKPKAFSDSPQRLPTINRRISQ